MNWRLLPCMILIVAVTYSQESAEAEENLLTSPDMKLISKSLNSRQINLAMQLTDGDTEFPVSRLNSVLNYVFEFPSVVSPSELIVHLPAADGDELIGKIEVFSSLVSPDTGYHLLRAVTVSTKNIKQSYDFRPVGTQWLMIRITPANDLPALGISEISVLGKFGAPTSVYEFKEAPAEALQVLTELESAVPVNISAAETDLFLDAADGKLDSWLLAEAALLASGVQDEATRAEMLQDIDDLEQAFRDQAPDDLAPFELAELLLDWLHEKAFVAGYSAGQTNLSTILTDGSFNCVSSAVLYNILGIRLGLDVRGVEVPDHAFAILYSGSEYADVETTTPGGFNPARNRDAIDAFQSTTGLSYIPDHRPDKRREISPLELIAFIYYNHGVTFSREEKYLEALLANFRALSLDGNSQSAVKNALAALANWSSSLSRESEFEEALRIVEAGLALAPEDRSLNHNHRVIWQNRIVLGAEKLDIESFTSLVAEAHAALPDEGFDAQQALYLITRAEVLAERGNWSAAITQTSDELPILNAESQQSLKEYRLNLVLRWSNQGIESRHWEVALDALERGLALFPENRRISQNIAYVLQEWSEQIYAASGEAAAEEIVGRIAARFPDVTSVRRAGRNYAIRRINELRNEARYLEALGLIREYEYLLGSDREFDTMIRSIFDAQADVYKGAGNMKAALAIYAQARRAFPDNKQIERNQVATWHEWASSHMDSNQWRDALDIYALGIESIPDERSFRQNTKYILQEWLKTLEPESESTVSTIREFYERYGEEYGVSDIVSNFYMTAISEMQKKEEFEASTQIALTGKEVIRDDRDGTKVHRYAYDSWAKIFLGQENWTEAIKIYELGLTAIPDDSRLRNNAVATWHSWAKTFMDIRDWDGAIEVYRKGLESMPDTRLFQQNIAYCEQERDRS